MDRAILRAILACLLSIFLTPIGQAIDSNTEKAIRAATFELTAAGGRAGSKGVVGTAFAIGPNEFVTSASLFDRVIGDHFRRPVLLDSSQIEYQIADIMQFSQQQGFAVFSLQHPPRVEPLLIRRGEQIESAIYIAGWRPRGGIAIESGTFSGRSWDDESGKFDWLRFSAAIWGGVDGGPLLDTSGRVIGIIQGTASNEGASYALPVGVLPDEVPARAHIHDTEILRFLMPLVSTVEPLEAEIPLPTPFDKFRDQLEQIRLTYVDRTIGPLLEATHSNFALTGNGAADVCDLLNGNSCECKARADIIGTLEWDKPFASNLIRKAGAGGEVVVTMAGVVVFRKREAPDTRAQRHDPSSDARLHLDLVLKRQASPIPLLPGYAQAAPFVSADQDRVYIDFRDRTWHLRSWKHFDQELEVVSLARKLPDGYVVLSRIVPASLSYAAVSQLKLLANLVYYSCDGSPPSGAVQVADAMGR
jgi:serine protease Do